MGSLTETRTKLMDIGVIIADVHFALINEDYEDLQAIRELVEKVWNDSTPRMKNSTVRYIVRVLNELNLHEQRDLNGFFSNIVGEKIAQYQTVKA